MENKDTTKPISLSCQLDILSSLIKHFLFQNLVSRIRKMAFTCGRPLLDLPVGSPSLGMDGKLLGPEVQAQVREIIPVLTQK